MVKQSLSLKNKVALVTGGKRGIGKGIALAFAEAGADVAICSRGLNDGALEEVSKEIKQFGRRALAMQVDVSKASEVEAMVLHVTKELGPIDILVNNAAIITRGQLLVDVSEEDWDKQIDINLKGLFLCARTVGKQMVLRRKGNIINITSNSGFTPTPTNGVYSISKAGAWMLTKVLAQELGKFNIRVNAISPSWVKTEMNAEMRQDPQVEQQIAKSIPLGRLGEPEDIGKIAVFLASEVADYITGQTIIPDGGMLDFASATWATPRLFDPFTSVD